MGNNYSDLKNIEYLLNKDSNYWDDVSKKYKLSQDMLFLFRKYLNWDLICQHQTLSEESILKFKGRFLIRDLCKNQQLTEKFIEENENIVLWSIVSIYQNLSENFISKFSGVVYWDNISEFQKLSEEFIIKYEDKINWNIISRTQKLSENFIQKYFNRLNSNYLPIYQNLSKEFLSYKNLKIEETCWLNKNIDFKRDKLKKINKYSVYKDHFIAYKVTRGNGLSIFKPTINYNVNSFYELDHCDCNEDIHDSFGLSVWDQENALNYYSYGNLYKVKVNIDDVGVILYNGKIRCYKLEVIEQII